jgi:superfamily II helicase
MSTVTNRKVCRTCGEKKSLSEFNLKRQEKFVYEPDCKKCQKEKMLNDPEYTNTNFDYLKNPKAEITHVINVDVSRETLFPEKTTPNKSKRKLRIH